jgi:predicted transcriptional regulator
MVITLDPKLKTALNELARRQGVSPEALALEALRERFLVPAPADESQDEWERRLRQTATDCGVSLPDAAVSSEGIYE